MNTMDTTKVLIMSDFRKRVKAMRAVSRGIRFPAETWERLQAEADKNHRTAAAQVQLYVEAGLEADNAKV